MHLKHKCRFAIPYQPCIMVCPSMMGIPKSSQSCDHYKREAIQILVDGICLWSLRQEETESEPWQACFMESCRAAAYFWSTCFWSLWLNSGLFWIESRFASHQPSESLSFLSSKKLPFSTHAHPTTFSANIQPSWLTDFPTLPYTALHLPTTKMILEHRDRL